MKLSDEEINRRLTEAPGWRYVNGCLEREFKFADFKTAFAFMTRVAEVAERLNHHPDWSNVYNRVTIRLNTHEVGGLSELDFELAKLIDQSV
jgi:4a-hydroxytetrahydrobiopterin dehydratase